MNVMGIKNLFKHKEGAQAQAQPVVGGIGSAVTGTASTAAEHAKLSELVLNTIGDGVIIVDTNNTIQLINPAALLMTGHRSTEEVVGLDLAYVMKLENGEGVPVEDVNNSVAKATREGRGFLTRDYVLLSQTGQKRPVAITVTPADTQRLVTFRDITKELEEEGAQAEFISTASHEMRTPVASIEGYLGLALNPQTATIDERARKYLEEAHASSKHLGRLFQDLLDVTKLDDKRIKVRLVPLEVGEAVRNIVEGQTPSMQEKNIRYSYGSTEGDLGSDHKVMPSVYASLDLDFLREIINNLVENAVKYTDSGGAIWINVRGDGDRVLINVTDTGMGISPDNLKHVFQKFYRVDNSQTRTIGGTGLGLYLVKTRVEAMNGKVWVESSFGEGSTFYVSFPRLTVEEYERQRQVIANNEAMGHAAIQAAQNAAANASLGSPQASAAMPLQNNATPSPLTTMPSQLGANMPEIEHPPIVTH